MEIVLFAVAQDIDLDALPKAGIDAAALRIGVEGNLKESTIVFKADLTLQPDGSSTLNFFSAHRALRYTAHNAIGDQFPRSAVDRPRHRLTEIIDNARRYGQG